MVITCSKWHSMDQPVQVANPARGQLNRENLMFSCLSPFTPESLSSSLSFSTLRLNHQYGIWCLITGFLPLSAVGGIHLLVPYWYRQPPPSNQSLLYYNLVHQVTELRTDGVYCRESAGTVPLVLGIIRVTGAAFSAITMDQFLCASLFLHPHGMISMVATLRP